MVHLFSIKYPLKSKRNSIKHDLLLNFLLALKKNKQ